MNKYYTPSIEEFYVGFEYESSYDAQGNGPWSKRCVDDSYQLVTVGDYEQVRVKYLDIDDILSFGFTLVDEYDDLGQATFEKEEWFIVWTKDATEIHYGEDMVFCGKLKNKSEFGRILKQLEIHEAL